MNDEERIEQYINGKMNREERDVFESDLVTDGELKAKLSSFKLAKKVSKNIAYLEAEEILERFEKQLKRKRILWTVLPAAAVVILILFFVGINGFRNSSAISESEMIAEFIYVPKNPVNRSAGDGSDPFKRAEELYHLNRFDESNEELNQAGIIHADALKLRARNNLKLNLFSEALIILKTLDQDDPEKEYLEALAYIGLKEFDNAKENLEKISSIENKELSELASRLLDEIKDL